MILLTFLISYAATYVRYYQVLLCCMYYIVLYYTPTSKLRIENVKLERFCCNYFTTEQEVAECRVFQEPRFIKVSKFQEIIPRGLQVPVVLIFSFINPLAR